MKYVTYRVFLDEDVENLITRIEDDNNFDIIIPENYSVQLNLANIIKEDEYESYISISSTQELTNIIIFVNNTNFVLDLDDKYCTIVCEDNCIKLNVKEIKEESDKYPHYPIITSIDYIVKDGMMIGSAKGYINSSQFSPVEILAAKDHYRNSQNAINNSIFHYTSKMGDVIGSGGSVLFNPITCELAVINYLDDYVALCNRVNSEDNEPLKIYYSNIDLLAVNDNINAFVCTKNTPIFIKEIKDGVITWNLFSFSNDFYSTDSIEEYLDKEVMNRLNVDEVFIDLEKALIDIIENKNILKILYKKKEMETGDSDTFKMAVSAINSANNTVKLCYNLLNVEGEGIYLVDENNNVNVITDAILKSNDKLFERFTSDAELLD